MLINLGPEVKINDKSIEKVKIKCGRLVANYVNIKDFTIFAELPEEAKEKSSESIKITADVNSDIEAEVKNEVELNFKTALDPIIAKNEPHISSIISNFDRYTHALATNEERTKKLIDQKIEATEEITDLAKKSGNLVVTSDNLIKEIYEDFKRILTNTRHITRRFKTLLSEFNVSLNLVNRLLKHIEPRAITKFFKNIDEIRSTLKTQTQHVQDIKHDVEDISDDIENFVRDFSREAQAVRRIINKIKRNTASIDNYTSNLPEINDKIDIIIELLKSKEIIPGNPCCDSLEGINIEELNRLISSLADLSLEVEYYTHQINNLVGKHGPEFVGELISLVWKLDEFFGTNIDSLLQLKEVEGSKNKKHSR